ncbi:Phosphoglycerate mutase-like protein 4 [Linum perenne]
MSTCAALTPFTLYRAAAGPESSLTLHRLPNLSVAGSIKGYSRPLLSARRRHGSNRRSALFVNTVEQLEFMSESNSNSSSAHPTYTEIVVVRHGETEWNAGRKIQGHTDVELNEAGRQQAALVAERLSNEPKISAVYSSDLKRAFYTAQEIAKRCGGLEGGGESLDTLYERCTSSFQRIAAKHRGERVVVVSHGGTIRALHKRACPDKRPGTVLNTSVHVFHLSDGDQWSIKSWGDVSHLSQTGFIKSGFGGDRTSG